jgi:hypothetical protein
MALHLIALKQAEHDGWLALPAPEYAGAAKCSLLIEQLRYELGESSPEQMAVLWAISDSEVELSAAEYKGELQLCSKNNRWIRQLPVCCHAECRKPLQQPRPLCCAQCRVAVYCGKACQAQVLAYMRCFVCCHLFLNELTFLEPSLGLECRPQVCLCVVCASRSAGCGPAGRCVWP